MRPYFGATAEFCISGTVGLSITQLLRCSSLADKIDIDPAPPSSRMKSHRAEPALGVHY
jgi:hypothetical protein